jgi:non-canonical purine NTP pyrophosphatase (RdgB/HAM1 family)
MKRAITFITGNDKKLDEMRSLIPTVIGKSIDLPEVQSLLLRDIIIAKVEAARPFCDGPFIVDDTALYLECFNDQQGSLGLPGPMIKWFLKTVRSDGLATIAHALGKTGAVAKTMIGFSDGDALFLFEGSIDGTIVVAEEQGGLGWDYIFKPTGYDKTFGHMTLAEKNSISMRGIAARKLQRFLQSYQPCTPE